MKIPTAMMAEAADIKALAAPAMTTPSCHWLTLSSAEVFLDPSYPLTMARTAA